MDGARVLITGGLGFIGSNLAIRLVDLGAKVTIVDSMLDGYGGNLANIAPIRDRVTVNISDVRDAHGLAYLVGGQDYIFHLAAQCSHIKSLTDPFPDIDINIHGTANLMEACKRHNPSVKIIYGGTRGQYGPVTKLPASEDTPMNPKGIYEISHLTAEKMVLVYHNIHGIKAMSLRLSNVYGPRAQMRHSQFGVVNWFVRLALEGRPIPIFGSGRILRDFLYVDDCVEALLAAAVEPSAVGEILNVGHDRASTFLEVAEILRDLVPGTSIAFTDFTPERRAQEPGDFVSDIAKIRRLLGWEPRVALRDGLARTVEFYDSRRTDYF